MTPTLIAALLVGLAAPLIRGWVWGAPFSLLSVATVLRSFLGSALTVLVFGVVAVFALRATSIAPDQIGMSAGLIGGGVGLLLLLGSARRLREVRGLSILCQRLQEEDAQPTATAALARLLRRVRRKDEQRYIALVLMATGPLTQAGMWDEARERLRSLDDDTRRTGDSERGSGSRCSRAGRGTVRAGRCTLNAGGGDTIRVPCGAPHRRRTWTAE